MQRAQRESRKGRRAESRTTTEVLSKQIGEYTQCIENLAEKSYPQSTLEASEGRGHADRVDLLADAGRPASLFPDTI
jgi:hypothetical protein